MIEQLKRLLLTGASGYIGTKLIDTLKTTSLLDTCQLFAVVKPGRAIPNVTPIFWDMRESLPEADMPRQIDAVIHLATERARGDDSLDSLTRHIRLSVDAVARLYDWSFRHGARKIIHFSSASVYQTNLEQTLLSDDTPLVTAPSPPYCLVKRWSDELACEFRPHVESVHIIRPTQVYGPQQTEKSMLGGIAKQLQTGKPFSLASPNGCCICPVYIDDLLYVVLQLLDLPSHQTVVVAGPDILTERQVVEDIARLIGIDAVINTDSKEPPEMLAFMANKLNQLMPARPQTPWATGLPLSVQGFITTKNKNKIKNKNKSMRSS